MSYNVYTIPPFDKQLKRLAKKYHSLKNEYAKLIYDLENNPVKGKALANNCYKIRLAIASKGKGKSSGARVITHFVVSEGAVYLLSIYDKSDKNSISDNELLELLKHVKL